MFEVTTDYLLKDNVENEEFTKQHNSSNFKQISFERIKEIIVLVYWLVVTVIYFIYSFTANTWIISCLIFVVGGILFTVLMAICDLFLEKNKISHIKLNTKLE